MRTILGRMKLGLTIVIACVVSACSSVHEKAGEEHVSALSKWAELAVYTESGLRDYPIAITAQPTLENVENVQMFVFKNIGLSRSDNPFNVDLLRPVFEGKYLCTPVCRHLLEVHHDESGTMSTLLSTYFSNHELELFEFYGALYMLNTNLEELRLINESKVSDYLTFLASQEGYFSDLKGFLSDLEDKLQAHEYINFLSGRIYQQQSAHVEHFSFPSAPDHGWLAEEKYPESVAPEQDGLEGQESIPPESKEWQTLISTSEAENWVSLKNIHFDHRRGNHQLSNIDEWLLAKNISIDVGDYVCSFSDNQFGIVTKLEQQNVEVQLQLQGQVKQMHDGLISDVEQGVLFDASSNELAFVPKNELQTFSLQNLAVCFPQ